ncbi:MAG TPA: PIN domain-containing protein [Candidatus Lokiarchaeia archaeon]|nr:PIN domain-containing protein [Candidatus Lokiarchaeia archaeon]
MVSFIVDSVAFLSYLADVLPTAADALFKQAENNEIDLVLPSIVLGETLYTIYKGKEIFGKVIPLEKVDLILDLLRSSDVLQLVDMNVTCWEIFHDLKTPELHDRMIIATFKHLGCEGIITNDPDMKQEVNTIWS